MSAKSEGERRGNVVNSRFAIEQERRLNCTCWIKKTRGRERTEKRGSRIENQLVEQGERRREGGNPLSENTQ